MNSEIKNRLQEEYKKAKQYATIKQYKQAIRDIRHPKKEKKSLSFSKWCMIFMVVNCTAIEIFSCVAMWHFGDLSALTTLVATVVGECISICGYFWKSMKENTLNGITYELAMKNQEGGGGIDGTGNL